MARKDDLTGDDSEICLHRAVQHPIVVELAKFLGDIGGAGEYICLRRNYLTMAVGMRAIREEREVITTRD